jgi:hypothetical protein
MTNPFAADYAEARAKFRDAAAAADARVAEHPHPLRGPKGEALATDTAWIGPEDAAGVVVAVSGTHGVEGYAGSAAQVEWLRRGEAGALPKHVAVLLVHAVNPHGFAWDRRVDEDNVDLNRNWVDFTGLLPANPAYAEIAEALCPATWSEASRAASARALDAWRDRHGMAAFQHAVSAGQHDFPHGLFYGGRGASWSRRTLTGLCARHLARAERVAFVDVHTGLGPAGYGSRIVAGRPGDTGYRRAAAWWGSGLVSAQTGDSPSAPVQGDWITAAPTLAPHAEVGAMVLEFGTVAIPAILGALRASAWLHAHGDPLSAEGETVRAAMRAAFRLDDDLWRGMVLGQALLAMRQAAAGVA